MYQDIAAKEKQYHSVTVTQVVRVTATNELKQLHKIKQVEHRPCLFPNGKGGWHVQNVTVKGNRIFQSGIKRYVPIPLCFKKM